MGDKSSLMRGKYTDTTAAITHDHTMYSLAERRSRGERAVFSREFAPLIRKGGVNVIGWVIGGDPPFFGIGNMNAWSGSIELLEMIRRESEESRDTLALCLDFVDIENAVSAGKIAVILTLEGGAVLDEDSSRGSFRNLQTLYRLGVRSLQLVGQGWNKMINADRKYPGMSRGLTPFGRSVVLEMDRLGMVIDTAHIPDPDPAFREIVELSRHPVIDSHRGVRAAADIPRNISDDRIKAIAGSGGVIGVQFFSAVLTGDPNRRATVRDLIRHIDHIIEVVGIDHVCLGPDFLDSRLADRGPDHYIEGIEEISALSTAADALAEHGYTDTDIGKILGKNMLRVYKQVIG